MRAIGRFGLFIIGLVHVGLLCHFGGTKAFPGGTVYDFVPQQGAALALFGLQRGFGDFELVNELGDFRLGSQDGEKYSWTQPRYAREGEFTGRRNATPAGRILASDYLAG